MPGGEIVVVTGCCGRIGRAVANTLCGGRKVRGFDSNPRPQGLLSDIELVHGRLEDADAVSAAISGADAVVHLAACPDDADLAEALVPANILGVSNVLDACRRAGVKQVVVASSGKVHAGHTGAYPITLSTPTSVVCSYGATKLFAEGAAQAFAHDVPDATVTVIRFAWCPRTPADVAAMRAAWTEPGQGADEYLSPADAAYCVYAALRPDLTGRGAGYALVFCQSLPPPGRHARFDLEPARTLLGWQPHDFFPYIRRELFAGMESAPTIDDEVADDYTPNPALYPRSEELKEVIVAPSSDFTDIVTTQTTGGKIWDAARKLLDYLVADGLGDVRSVLELGAGCGWLGMSLARACPHLESVVLTELVDGGALAWLEHNIEANRRNGSLARSVSTEALDWAWVADRAEASDPVARVLLERHFDLVIGSDLVYDHAGATALVRVLLGAARIGLEHERRLLYAHTVNRFEDLDLEFFGAIQRSGLRAERVWAAPDRPPTPEEPFAELFPQQWVGIYEISVSQE